MPTPRDSLHARAMAHAKWASCPDPAAATATARATFLDRFDRAVDPDGTLPAAERARRAAHARKAYFIKLARASARNRAARKAAAPATEKELRHAVTQFAGDDEGGDAA